MLLIEQQLKEEEEAELELQGVGTTLVGPGGSMLQLELVMQRRFEAENFRSRLRVSRLASFSTSFYSFVWLGDVGGLSPINLKHRVVQAAKAAKTSLQCSPCDEAGNAGYGVQGLWICYPLVI